MGIPTDEEIAENMIRIVQATEEKKIRSGELIEKVFNIYKEIIWSYQNKKNLMELCKKAIDSLNGKEIVKGGERFRKFYLGEKKHELTEFVEIS